MQNPFRLGSFSFVLLGVFAAALLSPCIGQDAAPADPIAQITALVHSKAQQQQGPPEEMPGISAAVYSGKGQAYKVWAGYSNPTYEPQKLYSMAGWGQVVTTMVPPGEKLQANMVYELASITKTFTAAITLTFTENGEIDLDQPMNKWLPSESTLLALNCPSEKCADKPCPTIRDLLGMLSGIYNFQAPLNEDPEFIKGLYSAPLRRVTDVDDPNKFWLSRFVLDDIYQQPPESCPGDKFAYSNSNYILLGQILLDCLNYYSVAPHYHTIAKRSGVSNMYLGGYDPITQNLRAMGWQGKVAGTARRGFVTAYWTAGGLVGTPLDAAIWIYNLNQPGKVLKPETLKEMQTWTEFTPPIPLNSKVEGVGFKGYGLGLMWIQVDDGNGGTVDLYGHTGGSSAFVSAAMYIPAKKRSFSFIINNYVNQPFVELLKEFALILGK